ncbi:glycoside hydrolase [Aureobasidium pullulans EXF-150]|uniref:xylan 1,4-beta-xylosidase n=1 Tax=Aureobasidium pullulans EXF-150 TaxID=1043002 RepID=A0A074Y1V7_AURPU|nr:glycoside hydrolase [Aureobasidium pullulans EXF-150]KEQ89919.1 glycoside hydrolase [Aureobasidium pullulans EXF-150]
MKFFGSTFASVGLVVLPLIASVISASNSTCPPAVDYTADLKYVECRQDGYYGRILGRERKVIFRDTNTPQHCADYCGRSGYPWAGVEAGTQCFCGGQPDGGAITGDANCSTYTCSGDKSQKCGGAFFLQLYKINNPLPVEKVDGDVKRQPLCHTSPLCEHTVCDTSLPISERIGSLLSEMTLDEKIVNTVNAADGVGRLGLPGYDWWNEALHGLAQAPGVKFNSPNGSAFSYATSFPMAITTGSAFDDPLIGEIASVIGRETRAFANFEQCGYDFWTPNINTFLDPRWGRGQETPSEDSFHTQQYVKQLVPGLQGGLDHPEEKQIIATCKHFNLYYAETNRYGENYSATVQDLAEYFNAPFKSCVRDVAVGSVMCSYNAAYGVPSCASEYFLQDTLRENWNFNEPYKYVVGDCGAVEYIHTIHNFTDSPAEGAAIALNAGTDLDCGLTFGSYLNESIFNNYTTEARLNQALTRLYTGLHTVGYFDGHNRYANLSWSDVATEDAQALNYRSAWEGMVLLKNDGLLPLSASYKKVALIGPYANASSQMQGIYAGQAPYIITPLQAAEANWDSVQYAFGTGVNGSNTTFFSEAMEAAKSADLIIYLGGIDDTIERETMDRKSLTWPGNQLDLVQQLSDLSKPLTIVQFGGGQIDDSELLANDNVNALLWAGYPGQEGGNAVVDILLGKQAPAGRLTTTQYAASYVDEVSFFNPDLRPNGSYPGRTYKWYTGKPVLPFGYGLSYTTFDLAWCGKPLKQSYRIRDLFNKRQHHGAKGTPLDTLPFVTLSTTVSNTGNLTSDFSALLFLSTSNAGPAPYPNKWLVSYARAHGIAPGKSQTINLDISIGSLARADENGDLTVYPGKYRLAIDNDELLKAEFELVGEPVIVDRLTRQGVYEYTVPVHYNASANLV